MDEISLFKTSIEKMRLLLPLWSESKLFEAASILRKAQDVYGRNKKKEDQWSTLKEMNLLRRYQIIENELRFRWVTRIITKRRKVGTRFTNLEKIALHSRFTKWMKREMEKYLVKIIYVKK